MDEGHFLSQFLEEKLPTLGLDSETYGPYIVGLLPFDENPDGADEDEWESVMELLQASSESHSDDEEAWKALKVEVTERYSQFLEQEAKRKADEEEIRRQEALKPPKPTPTQENISDDRAAKKKSSALDDATKKAVLEQYAYVMDENEVEGPAKGGDDTPTAVVAGVNPNKEAAKQSMAESANERKEQKGATKKEEQKKTKEANLNKVQQKEERRKRATKGERKR